MAKQEKSNFSVTCSLLSQFLKKNRSFGDLISPLAHESKGSTRTPTTMSLLPGAVVSQDQQESQDAENSDQTEAKSVDLFPQHSGFASATAPLTIFYGGKVLVFNNFPQKKVRDLIQLANKGLTNPTHTSVPSPASSELPPRPQPPTSSSGMPIARKVSLHRFFEKRKERINAKAPYQVNSSPGLQPKAEEGKSWLGLCPQASMADQEFQLKG